MTPTPFTDQALEYVDNMDWMTSDELTLCFKLYADAEQADECVAQADAELDYAEAFLDGRDAVSHIRSIIRTANARRAQADPKNKLLSTCYNNGRSAWIYLFGITVPNGARYAVRYYDTHDDETFTVHYFDRYTVDHDCATFLGGGSFCRS